MHALLNRSDGVLVQGHIDKEIVVDTLLPDDPGRFPWGGHLGIKMLDPVVREIAAGATTLSSPTPARRRRSGTRRSSARGPSGRG
jgi:hypothetical protein